jgi:hypothetical protein
MVTHKHHIIPKHAGGTDDPDNLVELTVEEHAQAHLDLYNKYGNEYDQIAYRMLSGQISVQEATRLSQVEAANKRWTPEARKEQSKKYLMNNPLKGRKHTAATKKLMSEKQLKTWTPERRESHAALRRGKTVNSMPGASNPRARKVHAEGVVYDTQTECQLAYGITHHNTIRYRCLSDSPKWKDWYYGI